jgi:hypothetical protein
MNESNLCSFTAHEKTTKAEAISRAATLPSHKTMTMKALYGDPKNCSSLCMVIKIPKNESSQ